MNKIAEKIKSKVRDYIDAINKKDTEKAISFFTDDATWTANEGTFKGREELKRYINWMFESLPDITFSDDGIGIIVQENIAVYQHTFEATVEGIKIKVPSICVYKFSGEKCKNHWAYNDRLSSAKQAVTGPIARKAVNTLINRMEKGL